MTMSWWKKLFSDQAGAGDSATSESQCQTPSKKVEGTIGDTGGLSEKAIEKAASNLYAHHLASFLIRANPPTDVLQRLGDAVGRVKEFNENMKFSDLRDPLGNPLDLGRFQGLGSMELHSFTPDILAKPVTENMILNSKNEYEPLTPRLLESIQNRLRADIADPEKPTAGGFVLSEGVLNLLSRQVVFADAVSVRRDRIAAAKRVAGEQTDQSGAACLQPVADCQVEYDANGKVLSIAVPKRKWSTEPKGDSTYCTLKANSLFEAAELLKKIGSIPQRTYYSN